MTNGQQFTTSGNPEKPNAPEAKERREGLTVPGLFERVKMDVINNPDQDANEISALKENDDPNKKKSGLTILGASLIEIVAKLKSKGADINLLRSRPQMIQRMAMDHKVELDRPELAAVDKISYLLNTKGAMSNHVRTNQFWQEIVDAGGSLREKWRVGFKESYQKNPVATTLVAAAGIVSIGLAVKWLFKKGKNSLLGADEEGKDSKGMSKTTKWLLGGTGVAGLLGGLLFFKGGITKWLLELLGTNELAKLQEELKSGKISVETRKTLENKGEEGKRLLEEMEQKGVQGTETTKERLAEERSKIESGQMAATEGSEKTHENAEKLPEADAQKALNYTAVFQSLTGIYCIDSGKFAEIQPKIIVAFEYMHEVPTEKLIAAYKKATGEKHEKVAFADLGMSENPDTDETALFHVAAIVSKANDQLQKIRPTDTKMDLETFFGHLSKDPTLEISHGVQVAMEEKFKELNITSLSDMSDNIDKIFDSEVIDQTIERNKATYFEHLATKYGIDLSAFSAAEKTEFMVIVGEMYGVELGRNTTSYALNQSEETVRQIAGNRSKNEKVVKATVDFAGAIKTAVEEMVPKCIEKYDIKRPDNQEYDQILSRDLKAGSFRFRDGLQMVLLADGINMNEPSSAEGVGQAKDAAMIFLIMKILKKRDPEAQARYLSNIIDLSTKESADWNINPNFAVLAPYFKNMFSFLGKKTKTWLERQNLIMSGMSDLNADPDKIKKLATMDTLTFAAEAGRSGARGAYEIPKELFLTVSENFGDLMNSETTGTDIIKMAMALGGTLIYSQHDDKNLGLLYLYGKYHFIKPFEIAWDSLKGTLSEGVGMKTYLLGTAPFVALGVSSNIAKTMVTHTSVLSAALGGAKRGLLAPISLPINAYRDIRGIARYGKLRAINPWKYGSGNVANLEMTAKLFTNYDQKTLSESSGAWNRIKETVKHPIAQGRRHLYKDVYEGARLRWGKNFAVAYNDFLGLNIDRQLKEGEFASSRRHLAIDIKSKEVLSADSTRFKAKRMMELTEWLQNSDLAKLSDSDMMDEVGKIMDPEEVLALKERFKVDTKGFDELRACLGKMRSSGSKWRLPNVFRRSPAPTVAPSASPQASPRTPSSSVWQGGKGAKALRALGVAGAVAGTAVSAIQAGKSGYEALTTDVEGRAAIEGSRSAMWSVDAVAGGLATAGLLGAEGAAVTVGSTAALPLVVVTYVGNETFDSLKAENMVEHEWAQNHSYEGLLHEWSSSFSSIALGDLWRSAAFTFSDKEISDEVTEKRFNIIHRQFRTLIAEQKNPDLMAVLANEEPSEEKNKKVEELINKSYTKYHECYFKRYGLSGLNYGNKAQAITRQEARNIITAAQTFEEIMTKREAMKKEGKKEWTLAGINILDDKFNVDENGVMAGAQTYKDFPHSHIVDAYKEGMINSIKEVAPTLLTHLEKMDTAYLLRLYISMRKALENKNNATAFTEDPSIPVAFGVHMNLIRNYLVYERNLNFEVAVRENEKFFEELMKPDEILTHLEGMSESSSKPYNLYEERMAKNPATNAVYRLAEYLGYTGDANESGLRQFFSENRAGYQGLYWDGEDWVVQERGMEFDDTMGEKLDDRTVFSIINRFKEQPDNILGHRQDTIFYDADDYSKQVLEMANVMENGYTEGEKKKRERKESGKAMALSS